MNNNLTPCLAVLVVAGLFTTMPASAYKEKPTHPDLSSLAYQNSVLSTDPVMLKNLGTDDTTFDFPAGASSGIGKLFRYGAEHEDDGLRSGNHFYDPKSDAPLWLCGLICKTSPTWALEDKGNISSQEFSFKDARKYLYEGLTRPDKTARNALLGKTFASLGNIGIAQDRDGVWRVAPM